MEDQTKINAALVQEAAKAGLLDLDGLKLADVSKVGLNHRGEVVGARQALEALKEAHPLLFPKPFHCKDATPEEIAAEAKRRGLNVKRH